MKTTIKLCIGSFLMLSLFTTSINAVGSAKFSFNFNGALLEGDVNGIYYEIGHDNAKVYVNGSWHLSRDYTVVPQSATCKIALRRGRWGTDEAFGLQSIGTVLVESGDTESPSVDIDLGWTAGIASDEYYLVTSCNSGSGATYKVGEGDVYWF